MFASDSGIFPKGSFKKYVEDSTSSDLSSRLDILFETLDTDNRPPAKRPNYLCSPELDKFRYINGKTV
jgi:hypothetical protein